MRRLIPFFATAAVIAAMIWQSITPETVLMPAPEVVFPDVPGASVEELAMDESERQTLPADTVVIRRMYRFKNGHWFVLSAVIGGRSKSSVHRPELCLPGQGYRMSGPHTVNVDGIDWRRLDLERGDSGRSGFAYTFVNGSGFRTASHLVRIFTDVWDRSIRGRIDRWVMLTVSSSCVDDHGISAFLEKLKEVVK